MRLNPFRLAVGAATSLGCIGAWLPVVLLSHDPLRFSMGLNLMLACAAFGGWCLWELKKYN